MEITPLRREQIIDYILSTSGPVYKINIKDNSFISAEEEQFLMNKFSNYRENNQHSSKMKLEELQLMIKIAKQKSSSLKKDINRNIQSHMGFLERNSSCVFFLTFIAFGISVIMSGINPYPALIMCFLIIFIAAMIARIEITSINDSILYLDKRTNLELKTLLTHVLN